MARGRKTGGRDWKKGQGGRPRGAKDRLPRGCLRAAIAELQATDPSLVYRTLRAGLKDKRRAVGMLQVIARVEGELKLDVSQLEDVAAALKEKFILELHPGPGRDGPT